MPLAVVIFHDSWLTGATVLNAVGRVADLPRRLRHHPDFPRIRERIKSLGLKLTGSEVEPLCRVRLTAGQNKAAPEAGGEHPTASLHNLANCPDVRNPRSEAPRQDGHRPG